MSNVINITRLPENVSTELRSELIFVRNVSIVAHGVKTKLPCTFYLPNKVRCSHT